MPSDAVAPSMVDHNNSRAAAIADRLTGRASADSTWATDTAAAWAAFQTADNDARAVSTAGMQFAADTPFYQHHATLATAQADWWTDRQADYRTWVADVNAVEATHAAAHGSALTTRVADVSAAGLTYATTMSAAAEARTTARSAALHAFILETTGAARDFAQVQAQVNRDSRVALATAERNLVFSGDDEAYQAEIQAFEAISTPLLAAADKTHTAAETAAREARSAAESAADQAYGTASADAESAFETARIAAHAQQRRDTLTADTARRTQIALVDAAYHDLRAQSNADFLDTLGLATGTPFDRHALALAQAVATRTAATTSATAAHDTLFADTVLTEQLLQTDATEVNALAHAAASRDFDIGVSEVAETFTEVISTPFNPAPVRAAIFPASTTVNANQLPVEAEAPEQMSVI